MLSRDQDHYSEHAMEKTKWVVVCINNSALPLCLLGYNVFQMVLSVLVLSPPLRFHINCTITVKALLLALFVGRISMYSLFVPRLDLVFSGSTLLRLPAWFLHMLYMILLVSFCLFPAMIFCFRSRRAHGY